MAKIIYQSFKLYCTIGQNYLNIKLTVNPWIETYGKQHEDLTLLSILDSLIKNHYLYTWTKHITLSRTKFWFKDCELLNAVPLNCLSTKICTFCTDFITPQCGFINFTYSFPTHFSVELLFSLFTIHCLTRTLMR